MRNDRNRLLIGGFVPRSVIGSQWISSLLADPIRSRRAMIGENDFSRAVSESGNEVFQHRIEEFDGDCGFVQAKDGWLEKPIFARFAVSRSNLTRASNRGKDY